MPFRPFSSTFIAQLHAVQWPGSARLSVAAAAPSREFSRLKVKLGMSATKTFHSFRQSLSTINRYRVPSIRESWVEALLGHEGGDDRTLLC